MHVNEYVKEKEKEKEREGGGEKEEYDNFSNISWVILVTMGDHLQNDLLL